MFFSKFFFWLVNIKNMEINRWIFYSKILSWLKLFVIFKKSCRKKHVSMYISRCAWWDENKEMGLERLSWVLIWLSKSGVNGEKKWSCQWWEWCPYQFGSQKDYIISILPIYDYGVERNYALNLFFIFSLLCLYCVVDVIENRNYVNWPF